MRRKAKLRFKASVVASALIVAACGQESGSPQGAPDEGSFPVTIQAANGTVSIPARPQKIVSLSPTATEMLFAIGAGDQVIAVDDQSNYPSDAPKTDLSGFQPNAEAVAARAPDLVVLANDTNEIVSALRALEIPTLLQPAATKIEDSYAQIEQLGAATGHVGDSAEVVVSMQTTIRDSLEEKPQAGLTYYHELDEKLFSVTSRTFIGQIYSLVGLENIADAAEGAATDYPQLSSEFIVNADPDIIFLADTKCCGQSDETVSKRPGWDQIAAVRNGAVIELDDDIASRWGPRIVELLEQVVGISLTTAAG